jgi:metal-sulfur cluster biosynthetic enzyme
MYEKTKPHENELKHRITMALKKVLDPELFVNIIDLGLVYAIHVKDDSIKILMTLSTPYCPLGKAITNGVRNVLYETFTGVGTRMESRYDDRRRPKRIVFCLDSSATPAIL